MTLLQQLDRFCSAIISQAELAKLLAISEKEQRPLRVKFGIDPTFPHVHIGHAVPIRLLKLFQDHGHLPILLLGDGTARLGDPTGRNDQRPPLTAAEVEHNAETYLDQIGRILDLSEGKAEVRRNSEWFGKMDFFDALQLAARGTAARMLERDDFRKRVDANLPVHLHEMMYPMMQGWDSVELHADIEIGGNDQLFNLHQGRQLQEREGQRPQVLLTTHLLMGTDGRKMSKTYGNHVPLSASPTEMYGKVMSLSDDGMADWFRLLTTEPEDSVASWVKDDPRGAKGRLAFQVTAWLHDDAAAQEAADEFVRRFRKKEIPDDIPEVAVPVGEQALPWVVKELGLVQTTSEARRMIEGRGLKIDGEVIDDPRHKLTIAVGDKRKLVQAGKRRFAYLVAKE
ncbi:MAG: tyrosine--tRNA ligase [Planctomycetes bacterium]|nr:tyrosine--tRNA ligase [Planctomycetota bacterium]MBT4028510.1 tyrosine--tRNA ligase [Planctomycetota bacterium]MBT4559402.1 tyrosine--tRNA ligase [Planctomycetota bacterium]MBT7012292.1 tyrosine--tRNA ligase [Planctomycetota bacterium]MBT7319071.1 tyrosine--tRNA ligase [Planctomycetota bacterium]